MQNRRPTKFVLTPLVDVIFLLLMFFMLSSSFTRYATLEISAPNIDEQRSRADDAPKSQGAFAAIIINLSQSRGLTVNGERQSLDTLVGALNRLYDNGARSAIVTTDRLTTVQQLVSAMEVARESRLTAITIAR